MSRYPRVRVRGAARERGRQYGTAARGRIRRSIAGYRDLFGELAGLSWDQVLAHARSFDAPIAAYAPALREELHGIAEGARVDDAAVLAINVRTEVLGRAIRAGALECSALAVLAPASQDGTSSSRTTGIGSSTRCALW